MASWWRKSATCLPQSFTATRPEGWRRSSSTARVHAAAADPRGLSGIATCGLTRFAQEPARPSPGAGSLGHGQRSKHLAVAAASSLVGNKPRPTPVFHIGANGMKSRIRSKASAAGAGCLALCLVVLGESSWAATAPIYKCLDRNLAPVYTDLACKNGERLDIRPGDADPAAVALLERERDELDRSAS